MEICTENGLSISWRVYICSRKDVLNLNMNIYQEVCSSSQFLYERLGILNISLNKLYTSGKGLLYYFVLLIVQKMIQRRPIP